MQDEHICKRKEIAKKMVTEGEIESLKKEVVDELERPEQRFSWQRDAEDEWNLLHGQPEWYPGEMDSHPQTVMAGWWLWMDSAKASADQETML